MKEIKQITMYKHEKIIILFIVQVHAFVEPFSKIKKCLLLLDS